MSNNLTKAANNAANNAANAAAKAAANAAANAAGNAAGNAPASQSTKSKVLIILVLVGIGLMALLGLIAFSLQMVNDGKMRTMEDKLAKQEEINKNNTAKQNSAGSIAATNMKRGDQGSPGIQGPPGPTGGVYAGAGP